MKSKDGSELRGTLCGTALVFADEIYRRVVVNRETGKSVARSLGLTTPQVHSVARIVRRGVPSQERLALICTQAPGIDDADIAEWFGRPTEWATWVRANADALRQREFIPAHMDWIADEWEPTDPTPEEIRQRCAEVRAKPLAGSRRPPVEAAVRCYRWQGGRIGSFFPIST